MHLFHADFSALSWVNNAKNATLENKGEYVLVFVVNHERINIFAIVINCPKCAICYASVNT